MNTATSIPSDYEAPPDLLAGRVILVTGAGQGIGAAVAKAFGAHGATVVLLGRTVSKLERVYDELLAAGAPEPAIYPMDLEGAAPEHHEELARNVLGQLGGLHGVVVNASRLGVLAPLEHYDMQEWLRVVQTNLHATFLLTRACIPLMRASARPDAPSVLLYNSSGVGRKGRAYWGAYSVTKFAMEGLMEVLADEVENEGLVRVNSVNPGATRTMMRAQAYPAEDPAKLIAPESLAPQYLYLMGPEGWRLHGQAVELQPHRPRDTGGMAGR